MRIGITCILFFIFQMIAIGQTEVGLVAYYSFDDGTALNNHLDDSHGVIFGNPQSVCGVRGNGLEFDGVNDFIQFGGNYNLFLRNDFAISFYFRSNALNGDFSILSKRSDCSVDSSFALNYTPSFGNIEVQLLESVTTSNQIGGPLNLDDCWHHVLFIREGLDTKLLLDGVQVDDQMSSSIVSFENTGFFSIADSPCIPTFQERFRGVIDELRIYNRALNALEQESLYHPSDRLVTPDTIIFVGGEVPIRTSGSCATAFSWSPSNFVDDPFSQISTLRPEETTVFDVNFIYDDGCTTSDQVKVTVVDISDLDCNDVFLPNAFTPNGDNLNDFYGLSNPIVNGTLTDFSIFDRWGSRVFQTSDIANGWDGSFNSQEVNPGLYIYKVKWSCDDEEKFKIGSFSLIR